ncbi:serrate RNA effector molecule homolog isoform X3 [Acropora millepora]|uniref:serrate RNA effector molecule homolog isoform X3 n=1 Tax=Acropora millepora TaxID=45264 RepID=UPI001CF29C2D|nr:serrate RNA effector molecule homolog isoform X3 [Acropora millepora]
MTINEKSINRLGGGREEAEAAKGEEDHVLENEGEVVLEVVATMITDEADYRHSRSSSSYSSTSSDDERRRSRKDKKSSSSSSQLSKEQTRKKMKKALEKAESKDEVLKRDKAAKELKQLAPDKEAILQIERNEFVPQSFNSSAATKGTQIDKEDKEGSHEAAMFGAKTLVTTPVGDVSQVKTPPQIVVSQANDKEGLFASWLHEDEETKTARWITKLKKMRQQLLAAT